MEVVKRVASAQHAGQNCRQGYDNMHTPSHAPPSPLHGIAGTHFGDGFGPRMAPSSTLLASVSSSAYTHSANAHLGFLGCSAVCKATHTGSHLALAAQDREMLAMQGVEAERFIRCISRHILEAYPGLQEQPHLLSIGSHGWRRLMYAPVQRSSPLWALTMQTFLSCPHFHLAWKCWMGTFGSALSCAPNLGTAR